MDYAWVMHHEARIMHAFVVHSAWITNMVMRGVLPYIITGSNFRLCYPLSAEAVWVSSLGAHFAAARAVFVMLVACFSVSRASSSAGGVVQIEDASTIRGQRQ